MSKYIGIMSGTSFDGVDAVLIDFSDGKPKTLGETTVVMPDAMRAELLQISQTNEAHFLTILYTLDAQLGSFYSEAVQDLLTKTNTDPKDIFAIGCHGQTIRHFPDATPPFTVQLGDPNIIAAKTGITTIADFRRRDLAHGGGLHSAHGDSSECAARASAALGGSESASQASLRGSPAG